MAIRYTIIIGRYSGQCIFPLLITVYVFTFYYAHIYAGIIDHSLLVPLGLSMLGPASHSFGLSCASTVNGRCRCTDDLLQLAAATVPQPGHCWPSYHTPIQVDQLVPFLDSHPDTAFATYILDGLSIGFRIGFVYRHCSLHSRSSNHPSSLVNKKVVDDQIAAEVTAGRLYGPLPTHLKSRVHVSPMGLVPKPHQANKISPIVDLSHPAGASVNNWISPTHYTTLQLMRRSASSNSLAGVHS